jgi:hypothetical protein
MDTISLYKHRIDALMDILFGAGVSNPQTIIEQLNYLLFLRALSIKDDEAELLGITVVIRAVSACVEFTLRGKG